ncbi:MAG: hypothetical protein AAF655_14315 [Bacteroidota bacterium]
MHLVSTVYSCMYAGCFRLHRSPNTLARQGVIQHGSIGATPTAGLGFFQALDPSSGHSPYFIQGFYVGFQVSRSIKA